MARQTQNEKVFFFHHLLTAVGSAIAIFGALYSMCQVFRSLSWYCRYINSRYCTLYFFLYHDDFYAPTSNKITFWTYIYISRMANKWQPGQVTLQKYCLWNTVNINWDNVQILKHDVTLAMPVTVTVPLTHKIKTRNIMRTEFEMQVTLKQHSGLLSSRVM